MLKFVPAYQRTLVAGPDRDDGPAAPDVVVDRLVRRNTGVHDSPTRPRSSAGRHNLIRDLSRSHPPIPRPHLVGGDREACDRWSAARPERTGHAILPGHDGGVRGAVSRALRGLVAQTDDPARPLRRFEISAQ